MLKVMFYRTIFHIESLMCRIFKILYVPMDILFYSFLVMCTFIGCLLSSFKKGGSVRLRIAFFMLLSGAILSFFFNKWVFIGIISVYLIIVLFFALLIKRDEQKIAEKGRKQLIKQRKEQRIQELKAKKLNNGILGMDADFDKKLEVAVSICKGE